MDRELQQEANGLERVAIIDCGTNTFSMIIVEVDGAEWSQRFMLRIPVFLGQGGFQMGCIRPDRFAKGIDALRVMHQAAINYGVQRVRVVGTSALRDAKNAKEFVQHVRDTLGWNLEIISGEEEAKLIHQGVQLTLNSLNDPVLIMDVGGGSVEFILTARTAQSWVPLWSRSVNAGVARLEEFGKPKDPLTPAGEERYRLFLESELSPIQEAIDQFQPSSLVGSSGVFDTLIDLVTGQLQLGQLETAGEEAPSDANRQVVEIDAQRLRVIHQALLVNDLEKRLAMKGMAPERARMIPLSSMLVQHVFSMMPPNARVYRSPFAMREGILDSWVNGNGPSL